MSTHAMNSQLPFHHIHFLHNLPPVYGKGLIERTATNVFRKAVYGAKWQNFAAGIGTGATYVSLHGLHWHPHWLTIVEYVLETHPMFRLHSHHSRGTCRMILFLINVAIFCVNLTLILINVSSTHNLDALLFNCNHPIFQYNCARACSLRLSNRRHHYLHLSLSLITGQYVSAPFSMLKNLARQTCVAIKGYFGHTLPFQLSYAPP